LLFKIVKGLHDGKISRNKVRRIFGLSSDALKELTANIGSVPYAGVGVKKKPLPLRPLEHQRKGQHSSKYALRRLSALRQSLAKHARTLRGQSKY